MWVSSEKKKDWISKLDRKIDSDTPQLSWQRLLVPKISKYIGVTKLGLLENIDSTCSIVKTDHLYSWKSIYSVLFIYIKPVVI